MGGKYGYYMLYRAPGPGCQPMDGLDQVVEYGGEMPMPDYNNRGAWGEAWYNRELTAGSTGKTGCPLIDHTA